MEELTLVKLTYSNYEEWAIMLKYEILFHGSYEQCLTFYGAKYYCCTNEYATKLAIES